MNIRLIATAAIAAAAAFGAIASEKRGVSENQFAFACQMRALTPGVHWYYNWGQTPGSGWNNEVSQFEDMEYVPMCWNGSYDADAIRKYVREHPGCKYLLGFNEPNFTNQANMTPAKAAEEWPAVQALARELGLKLVSPALNYSPNPPYNDPVKWMDEFYALVGQDAFDFTAIHNYGGPDVMKTLATAFHDRYGKPVWVTEFCQWPGGAGNVYVAPEAQIASMVTTVEWLEQTEWIYRYAWFKSVGDSDAPNRPNYGLLEKQQGTTESRLTEQGLVYCHMADMDRDVFHPLDTRVSAVEYVSRTGAVLGSGSHPDAPRPIEVTKFDAGATLDWQFDVPADGDYQLVLTVSGKGEPERFDPRLGLYEVAEDGTEGECLLDPAAYLLTGSDTEYKELPLPVTLKQGHRTIRLKDGDPYRPSGIRISMVELRSGASGVSEILPDNGMAVNVYSLAGIMVRKGVSARDAFDGLPAGLYIVNGRKYAVR